MDLLIWRKKKERKRQGERYAAFQGSGVRLGNSEGPSTKVVSCSLPLTPVGEGLMTCNTPSCSAIIVHFMWCHIIINIPLPNISFVWCLTIMNNFAFAHDSGNAKRLQSDWRYPLQGACWNNSAYCKSLLPLPDV